jgi:hypothetical protein
MRSWNAITVARVCRAGLAGLALVILSVSHAAAEYGPRTKHGDKYQQWSDETTLDGLQPAPCHNTVSCYVLFQAIPGNRPLIVEHATCTASISHGELRSVHLRTKRGQTFPFTWTPLVPVSTSGTWWAVNSPVIHLFKSGESPVVLLVNDSAAAWFVDCSISGTLQ